MGVLINLRIVRALLMLTVLSVLLTSCGSPQARADNAVHFQQAKDQYVGQGFALGTVGEVWQNQLAVADLKEIDPLSNIDRRAIHSLEQLERFPIHAPTAKDDAQAGRAVTSLDKFFGVSGFCSGFLASGPGISKAASYWFREPMRFADGVNIGDLRQAARWMQLGERAGVGDTTCYPAVIDDITDLELLVQKHKGPLRDPSNLRIAIGYVNVFFGQNFSNNEQYSVLETNPG